MDWAVLYAIASLVIVVILARLLKRFGLAEGATFIAVLMIPVVVWTIKSGTIAEFSAGGWTLKFQQVARDAIKAAPLSEVTEIQNLPPAEVIEKGGTNEIQAHIERLQPGKPVSLILNIDRIDYYQPLAIQAYIQAFLPYDPDMAVVLVDAEGRYVGSTSGERLAQFLDPIPEFPEARSMNRAKLADAARTGDRKKWLALPGFTDISINKDASNLDALKLMDTRALKSIITVDADSKPFGIAKRDAIVAHLVAQLAEIKTQ